MELQNEFRHILKGNEALIEKGREMSKHIKLPLDYIFTDALLFQLGAEEITTQYMEDKAKQLFKDLGL